MALTSQQQNFISELMQLGEDVLTMRERIGRIKARWNNNNFAATIGATDLDTVPSLSHLNKTKLANAIAALDAVLTALGDDVGGQATNLIKLKG